MLKMMIPVAGASAAALAAFAAYQPTVPPREAPHPTSAHEPAAVALAPRGIVTAAPSDSPISTALAAAVDAVVTPPTEESPLSDDAATLMVRPAQQPATTIAPAGAGGVPFTRFELAAGSTDVELRSITIERTGPGEDGIFEGVVIVADDGEELSDERRFDADHRIVFAVELVIPAGESRTFTVLGSITDDAARFAGQSPILALAALDASVPVVGELPLRGTPQTVNDTIVLGGASALRSPEDPGTDTRRFIGDARVRFSAIRLTADTAEDIELSAIAWRQDGTAGPGDVSNVVTVADGRTYATEQDGRLYTSTFSPALRIPRGHSIDLLVVGDLTTSGAGRTVQFDIDSSDDIALAGLAYGFGVGVAPAGNTATEGRSVFITSDGTEDGDEGTPFYAGSLVTIQGGTAVFISR